MSYAIETKKRKFERILESITDIGSVPSRTALNARSNTSKISLASDSSAASSKRRRITPIGIANGLKQSSSASLVTHYLPSSRHAFLERLESFRQVTKWHISSTCAINAVQWAKRGWICQDTDTVSCPSCKERLHVDVDLEPNAMDNNESQDGDTSATSDESDPFDVANEIAKGLVMRYQDMVITAHTETCPWKRRGCDNSIQRIEGLLNMPTAIAGLQERYQSMAEDGVDVPAVQMLPSTDIYQVNEDELKQLRFSQYEAVPDIDTLRLAMTGWQCKEPDIIECRHCFRSLGLWLYRGLEPPMENLNAIDSHLEYCPWRCPLSQDTELPATVTEQKDAKHKLPGWILAYLAIVKKNHKGKIQLSEATGQGFDGVDENLQPQLTPEQREKKMKDLVRRIRDLKRSFNVKSLLKRKEKP